MESRKKLPHHKIQTLIQLIDDPDETVFSEVKNQLILLGPVALPFLEKVWNETMNQLITQRIEEIIEDIKFNELAEQLIYWKYHQQEDLLYAVWLINHFQYSEVMLSQLKEEIEKIRKDIWVEFAEDLTAFEEIQIINHIIYDVHQFSANISNYYSVQNNYLHFVLKNKKGNNITLGILYLLIVQQLKKPIFAVNIPNYLILTYLDDNINIYDASSQSLKDAALFYINPFSKGTLLQQNDIEDFLSQMNIPLQDSYFTPCSHLDIIEKLLWNIANSYAQQGNTIMYSKYKKVYTQLKEN